MGRFVWIGSLASLAVAFGCAMISASEAADACVRKDFKTELVGKACARGGQAAAKDAMKAFVKEKQAGTCNRCHATLSPDYDLKPEGLEQFHKLGGK